MAGGVMQLTGIAGMLYFAANDIMSDSFQDTEVRSYFQLNLALALTGVLTSLCGLSLQAKEEKRHIL